MTRSPAILIRLVSLLALAAWGRAALAEDGSPRLLDQPSADGNASCPCRCHQETPVGTSSPGEYADAHGYQLHGGAHPVFAHNDGYSQGLVGMPSGALATVRPHLQASLQSGQPVIDPWARADWIAANRAAAMSWHAGYYNTQYGAPVALVVPPTARMQTRYGWGVSQSTMSPIYPQFKRPYPGPVMVDEATGAGPTALMPTPRWPSHTDQFGVYYVRGPW